MAITGIPTGPGDDIVTVTPGAWHSVNGEGGNDTLVVNYATLDTDVIHRNIGYGWWRITDDFFSGVDHYGFESFDIQTGSGDDSMDGGAQADRLRGGAGNDTIAGGMGADTIDGGDGHDLWTANYGSLNTAVGLTLTTDTWTQITATGARLKGIEVVSLTTGSGADVLDARAVTGNHSFTAGEGDDTFMVSSGRSSFNGGGGNDLLVADFAAATRSVSHTNLGYGWWRVGEAGGARQVDYYDVNRVDLTGGSGNDTLSGTSLGDRLVGNAGNDWLNGVNGTDTIDGGDGVDTWETNQSGVNTQIRVNLNDQSSNISTLAGIERLQLTAGLGNDRITAHAGRYNDVISTLDGADIITTGRGVDQVNGGAGIDMLVMDWSALDDPTQSIAYTNQGYGWWRFSSGSGDRVDFYDIEQFRLTGGAGNDTLVGRDLVDTLIGGGGDDWLDSAADRATVNGGDGTDVWAANLTAFNVALAFKAKASQTDAQLTKKGFSIEGIERVSVSLGAGNDSFSTAGFAGDDTMNGGAGNDVLTTGLGFDQVNGEAGNDMLVLDYSGQSADVVHTNQGYGWWRYGTANDSSHVDYYSIERFKLTGGGGNDMLSGAGLNDRLVGGTGDDTLNGGNGGSDVIKGGGGQDMWIMDQGAATVALSLTLDGSGTGRLVGNGTRLVGVESVRLNTGSGDDVINLSAVVGNHVLNTGEGNDSVNLGRGMVNEVNGGAGIDRLVMDGSLATSGLRTTDQGYGWWHVAALDGSYDTRYYGVESLQITGSDFNDRLYGQGGDDVLIGGAGRDILFGSAGNDVMTGGAGADMFEFKSLGSDGRDRVTDAASGDLLRFYGGRIESLQAGNGSGVGQWQAELATSGGVTTLYLGLDTVAGADFRLDLVGTYGVGSFDNLGYNDFQGAAELVLV